MTAKIETSVSEIVDLLTTPVPAAETEAKLDLERAMVLMGIWGSTSGLTGWGEFAYAEQGWVPDGAECCASYYAGRKDAPEESDCVTVLVNGFSGDPEISGYKVINSWTAGEHECPWCGPGTGNEESRESCELCEGDGLIYWGEEWRVVTYAPAVPSESEVSAALIAAQAELYPRDADLDSDDDAGHVDVRLQVYPNGTWALRVGESCYDLDHHGYWGAASLPQPAEGETFGRWDADQIARDLLSEVTSAIAENAPETL